MAPAPLRTGDRAHQPNYSQAQSAPFGEALQGSRHGENSPNSPGVNTQHGTNGRSSDCQHGNRFHFNSKEEGHCLWNWNCPYINRSEGRTRSWETRGVKGGFQKTSKSQATGTNAITLASRTALNCTMELCTQLYHEYEFVHCAVSRQWHCTVPSHCTVNSV